MRKNLNEESRTALPTDHRDPEKMLARARIRRNILILITLTLFSPALSPVFALPNGTETIITTDTTGFPDSTPVIYGDFIVCLEHTNVLMMYNLASGKTSALPLTDPLAYYPARPAIAQNIVAWQEYDGTGYARIVWYDLPSGTVKNFYDAAHDAAAMEFASPDTDGTTLVWQNYNTTNSDWDVAVVRNGASGPELILDSARNEKHPAVSGHYVVYENWTDPYHSSVWRFNLTDNTSAPVSRSSDQETFPQVSADRIVWQARNTTDPRSHIVVWENGRITRLTPPGVNQEKPALFGNRVAVEDYRRHSAAPDVYVYEYSTSWKEIWVAPNTLSAAQLTPAVWNNRIVWEDTRSGTSCGGCDSDVYLFTLGTPDTCPVADFTPSQRAGPDPVTVTFTDRSAGSPVLYRIWNYSDGTTSYPLDPSGETFSGAGTYHTRLTVGNTKCRNVTPAIAPYDIYVDSPPDADFTASPLAGFAPLTVQFTDVSGGDPASWTWDFGDGTISHRQNPVHIYATAGQAYTVSLTVNNTFAAMAADTGTKTEYIRTFLGATGTATIPVQGITVIPRYGGWFLIYNATMLPDRVTPGPRVLTAFHPGSAGWQNITFIADDAIGFSDTFGNTTYMGNLSHIVFQTEDVTASGMSPGIGTGWGVSYRFEKTSYPSPAFVSTAIWENTTAADQALFRSVIIGSNFIENPDGIAYTARITRNGISGDGTATINMSVNRSWLGGKEAHTFIAGFGNTSQGDTIGGVRPARFLFHDGTLDYFEAEVPEYFTTFGITPLSGSGNPFQLVTLSIASHISPPPGESSPPSADSGGSTTSGGGGGAVRAAVPVIAATATSTPAPVITDDPGAAATIYTNGAGVVTQAARLRSNDGRALISLGEGVVAKDAGGRPLSGMTIRALPSGSLPAIPPGSAFTFAGMAYEIGPDGATFSPPVTLILTVPQAQWGKDYAVKSFDRASGTWQDLPTSFDAATGTVTVQVSHLSVFALFAEPRVSPVTTAPAATQMTPVPVTPQVTAKPPTTAMSIFTNMIGWVVGVVVNNIILVIIVIVLAVAAVVLYRRRMFSGG